MKTDYWTQKEIDYLLANYKNMQYREIGNTIGRTEHAVRRKAYRLGKVKMPRCQINHSFFSEWSEKMAYILGFFASDGCLETRKRGFDRIIFGQKDQDILKKIRDALGSTHAISLNTSNDNYIYSFTSGQIPRDLENIFGSTLERKTKTVKMPDHLPNKYARHFCRGYMDGDGCLSDQGGIPHIVLVSASTELLNGFKDLVFDLTGIVMKSGCCNGLPRLHSTGIKGKCFSWWLYHDSNIHLDRKWQKAQEYLKWTPKRVWYSSVTPKMKELFPHLIPNGFRKH